jgi:hypothetical protein
LLPLECNATQEVTFMSLLAIPSSATAALTAVTIHPHGHGHKKGLQLDSTESSGAAGQVPAAATQNLFTRLFNSLAQVIGARPAQALQVNHAAQPAQSAQAAQLAIGSKINTTA